MKDKEQTKRKLIDAVGAIIMSEGFDGLRISKIARQAQVDRKLIYRYFGNINKLTEAYIIENDYWMQFAEQLRNFSQDVGDNNTQLLIIDTLQGLFKYFYQEPKMQNLILMELTGSSHLLRSIHNVRESMGQDLLQKTDQHFERSGINFRAVAGLLVGGIYYMVLHTLNNGYNFVDINLESEEGMKAVLETLGNVVDWAFEAASKH